MKKFSIFVIFIFYFLLSTFYITPTFAQEGIIGVSQIHPASPLYFLKSVREIFELKFAQTNHVKALRQLEFATRRIREVKSLVKVSREDLIEPTLERYLSHLQDLDSAVNFSDEVVAQQITEGVTGQMVALQLIYNQASDIRARMSLRTTIFRLSQRQQGFIIKLDRLSKPHLVEKITPSKLSACNFLAREASASAFNEVEKSVFGSRARICFGI